MSDSEEKLTGVDQALGDFGVTDAEVTEVRRRFARTKAMDLVAVDAELEAICGDQPFEAESTGLDPEGAQASPGAADAWENESTEVEIVDDSDFVLLVDEGELEELEKVGEDDAVQTSPAAPPGEEGKAEGEGSFFKKLFGGRRNSSSP